MQSVYRKLLSNRSRRKGFSLLEIILATVVLAVVAAVVARYATEPGERTKRQACDLHIEQLQLLAEQYRADFDAMPATNMSELAGARYLGKAVPTCPLDGRAYVLDRTTGTVRTHNHPEPSLLNSL